VAVAVAVAAGVVDVVACPLRLRRRRCFVRLMSDVCLSGVVGV